MERRARKKHERQDPHTPKTHLTFLRNAERWGGTLPFCPQAASSYLQPILANQLFSWLHPLFVKQPLRMDQPAVGILQVCVQLFVFIQRLWGSEGQLS